MPDFNPDREGHVDHRYKVIRAVRDRNYKSVVLDDGKEYKFGKDGWFSVPGDPKLAQALRDKVGMNATVTRVRHPKPSDNGHTYFFGQLPRLPWHKYDENGNRIKE